MYQFFYNSIETKMEAYLFLNQALHFLIAKIEQTQRLLND